MKHFSTQYFEGMENTIASIESLEETMNKAKERTNAIIRSKVWSIPLDRHLSKEDAQKFLSEDAELMDFVYILYPIEGTPFHDYGLKIAWKFEGRVYTLTRSISRENWHKIIKSQY